MDAVLIGELAMLVTLVPVSYTHLGADDSFHFHLEEEGGEAGDVDVRLHADDVDLQVVCL